MRSMFSGCGDHTTPGKSCQGHLLISQSGVVKWDKKGRLERSFRVVKDVCTLEHGALISTDAKAEEGGIPSLFELTERLMLLV